MTQANASQTSNGAAAAAPAPSAAEPSALDKALEQFNANAQPVDAVNAFREVAAPIVRYVQGEMIQKETQRVDTAVSEAIKLVKTVGNLAEVPDEIIEGQLHRLAAKSPEFSKAFADRDDSPDSWTAKLKDAVPQIVETTKKLTQASPRDDHEKALAAVRGVSHSPPANGSDQPSPTQMFQMTDREWANYKDRLRAGG